MDCIFCKIRDGEIPKEFTYEDKDVMVFPDINPIRPTHLLIVSKKHIRDFLDVDEDSLAKMTKILKKMIKETGLEKKGYRIGINGGGAQIISHLHIHLMGPWSKHEI
ncbi:MAG: hypothetical protein A3A51_02690 [Candidatus Levybacteria bacterium RIFCSPLOWO2_01_FULL_39_10]|nr:MAG: hypothetical protein A3A51_02690 [Candidatus Levybacteria bacterium RIFCSPLOWO2_01_FULL_39_10]